MRKLSSSVAVLLASAALAQEAPRNAPHVVKYLKAPQLEVRYLDFGWNIHYGDRRAKLILAR